MARTDITADQLRDEYLKFFESKGHKIIPGASLPRRACIRSCPI